MRGELPMLTSGGEYWTIRLPIGAKICTTPPNSALQPLTDPTLMHVLGSSENRLLAMETL